MDAASVSAELEANGFCVIPGVLAGEALDRARAALDHAIDVSRGRGLIVFDPRLDPNAHNIRLNNLPTLDPLFLDLVRHPAVLPVARAILGDDAILSNFTANVAYPGAGSMNVHSDQALICPAPWTDAWALNLIWCLDDVYEDNGATLYVPGSHHFQRRDDVPQDVGDSLRPFVAPAGSVIAMDGRLWHTSGVNRTEDQRRALLFAFYCRGFLRQQVNWEALLAPAVKAGLDEEAAALFGVTALGNIHGADLVMKSGYDVGSIDVYHPAELNNGN